MERQSKFLKLVQAQGVEERTLAIRLCNFEQREGSQQQKGELTWLEATLASSGDCSRGRFRGLMHLVVYSVRPAVLRDSTASVALDQPIARGASRDTIGVAEQEGRCRFFREDNEIAGCSF